MEVRYLKGLTMQNVQTVLLMICVLFSTAVPALSDQRATVEDIRFSVDAKGEAKLTVDFTNPDIDIDITQLNNQIVVVLSDSDLSEGLDKRLDVSDFATPVRYIDAQQKGSKVVVEVANRTLFTFKTKRDGNQLVLMISDKIIKAAKQRLLESSSFKGDLLDLNFQDIEVRDVLELIADFKSLNLVASDSVQGTITLNLNKVPWDQALDIILRSKGLDMRKEGNILLIAPIDEIAEREQKEIEIKRQLEELAPLETYVARIKYAESKDIYKFFTAPRQLLGANRQQGSGGQGAQGSTFSILSGRGSAIIDERTNTIILTDIAEKLTSSKGY
jgi:type IV pilus assembly protein PilQ